MWINLDKILQSAMSFEYIYNYGTSTKLTIKVISIAASIVNKGKKLIKMQLEIMKYNLNV